MAARKKKTIEKHEPRFRRPRVWSNRQLKRFAKFFQGDVVNVSAGDDVDKEGAHYKDYFTNAISYSLTNYGGASYRGFQARPNEIQLDLTADVPEKLRGKHDVVFNHTTLEHIFEVRTAFHTICALSKDIVILIVPFLQVQHENEGYQDFWRFTPTCLRRMFDEEGFTVLYEAANNTFNTSVYLFIIASRTPERWTGILPAYKPLGPIGTSCGSVPSLKVILSLFADWIRARLKRRAAQK
jgi:hypothetical protein